MPRAKGDHRSISKSILNESPFTLRKAPECLGVSRAFLLSLINYGKKSPVTKKIVRLECAFLASGVLATSVAAYERFQRRMNGAK